MQADSTRVQSVFVAAIEIADPAARDSFLDEACAGDPELKARVQLLLLASNQPNSLLDEPLVPGPDDVSTRAFIPNQNAEATMTNANGDESSDEVPLTFLSPTTRPDSLGRLGHYEVLQVLGRGGFGIVFRAYDDVLQRVVAVKVMAPQIAATSPARKRFLREARSSAAVRHENVVQVYEVIEQPLPYLVMEFIPGETLQDRLNRTGPLEVPETLRIGRQIAEGLAAAHACDLIHRDIKPGNILLEGGVQKVRITDFGLARAADDASISQSGIIAGTPMYMAPEQAKGDKLDQRADLFSLGSVLYQMAAGRPPFRANSTVAVLKRVAEDTPRDIREIVPEVPQWLCDIISKLHAKNPDDRYQSAREVADVLADCEAQLKANSKLKDFSRIPSSKKPERVGRSLPRSITVALWVLSPLLVILGIILVTKLGPMLRTVQGNNEVVFAPADGLIGYRIYQNGQPIKELLDATREQTLTLPPGDYTVKPLVAPGRALDTWKYETAGWTHVFGIWGPEELYLPIHRGDRTTVQAIIRAETRDGPAPAAKAKLPDGPIGPTDKDFLQGTWNVVGGEENGSPVPVARMSELPSYTFASGRYTNIHKGKTYQGTFSIDPLKTPRQMDMTPDGFEQMFAIYELNGDILRFCMEEPGKPRPTDFTTGPGSKRIVVILHRALPLLETKTPPVTVAPFPDADVRRIAALPAAEQVEEVRKELMRRNPGFDGKAEHKIEDGVVTEFHVLTDNVTDIAPLRPLTGLVYLDLRGTYPNRGKLADLSPLKGMRMSRLDCSSTQIADLTPLAGVPLTTLHVNHNPVSDLTPLKGMPLDSLGIAETKVSDLTPLKGLKLRKLGAQLLPVTDLSPLEGMPLTGLDLYHTIGVTRLDALKGMPLEGLNLQDVPVKDLAPLKDMSTLRSLQLVATEVTDLSQLAGLKLTDLMLGGNQITDLSPLKGLPLKRLHFSGTGVSDLRPLQGMSLDEIRLNPKNITQGLDILRDMKSLKTIGTEGNKVWPAAEFWERHEKGEFRE